MTFVTLDKLQLILQNINPLGLKNLLFISLWDLNCEVFLILDGILAIDFVSQTLNYFPRIVTIVLIMEYIHRIMRVRLYPVSLRKYVYFDLHEKNFEICFRKSLTCNLYALKYLHFLFCLCHICRRIWQRETYAVKMSV